MTKLKRAVSLISISALFLIPFYALIFDTSLLFPFVTAKTIYFRLLVEVAFVGWLFLVCIDRRYRIRISPMTVIVTIFALVALLTDLLGVQPLKSLLSNLDRMEGWIMIVHLWAFYLASIGILGSFSDNPKMWHRLFNISLAVSLIVSLYGLFQFMGLAIMHFNSYRIDSTFGNPDYLAIYLLIQSFIAAYMFTVARSGKIKFASILKWAYPILILLFIFDIFETGDRAVLLGLAAGLILSLVAFASFGKHESRKARLWAGGIVVLILACGAVFWTVRNILAIKSNPTLSRFTEFSLSDADNQGRLYVWPMALEGAEQHPLLGWGQENFNYVFDAHYNPQMYSQEPWFDRAHNSFLDWLVAGGIVGLLAYISLYAFLIRSIMRSRLRLSEKCVFVGLAVGLVVNGIFTFDVLANYVGLFLMLGFMETMEKGRDASEPGLESRSQLGLKHYAISTVAVVLLVFAVYMLNLRPTLATYYANAALDTCSYLDPSFGLIPKGSWYKYFYCRPGYPRAIPVMCGRSHIQSKHGDYDETGFLCPGR